MKTFTVNWLLIPQNRAKRGGAAPGRRGGRAGAARAAAGPCGVRYRLTPPLYCVDHS